jgi:alpha-1,4-digalacturonate transport system substrate-binding protein
MPPRASCPTFRSPPRWSRSCGPFLVDWAEVNGKEWIDQFVKGWADGAKLGDKVIAAPLDVTAVGIFYNADAFAKAGVPLPQPA